MQISIKVLKSSEKNKLIFSSKISEGDIFPERWKIYKFRNY